MKKREISRCEQVSAEGADCCRKAAQVIGAGGIVAIPTETSYGLAVDPFNPRALAALFEIKRRPPGKPVLVLIDSLDRLERLSSSIPAPYEPLIERHWPGPLTLIFPARPELPELLTAGTGTIGVRISSHRLATEICRRSGGAITATSANLSGRKPARSVAEVRAAFARRLELIVDGGTLRETKPSTVATCSNGVLTVVRQGAIHL